MEKVNDTTNPMTDSEEEALKKAKLKELIVQALLNMQANSISVPELDNIPPEEQEKITMKEDIYLDIIKTIPLGMGKKVSKQERAQADIKSENFAYGEIVCSFILF